MPTISRPERTEVQLHPTVTNLASLSRPQHSQDAPSILCRVSQQSQDQQTIFTPLRYNEFPLVRSIQEPTRAFSAGITADALVIDTIGVNKSWGEIQDEIKENENKLDAPVAVMDADWALR